MVPPYTMAGTKQKNNVISIERLLMSEEISHDVCIIGGGFSGLACARALANDQRLDGLRIVVVEVFPLLAIFFLFFITL